MGRLVGGNAGEGAQTGQTGSWDWAQKCAGVARLVSGNAGEGAQMGQSRVVGLGAKVRRRGAAREWECGQRYADMGWLMRGNAAVGAQIWGGSWVGMRAKVRRRGKAGSWGWARKGVWVRAVCSSESIGAYRNQSEFIGGTRLTSDKF